MPKPARKGVCPGCGFGGMRDCDYGGPLPGCGCGAVHDHDPMVKSKCVWLFWPNGRVAR